ncbi:hypothetical protein JCM11251_004143 [Rhodosporidiobolus azoricus]
MLVQSRSLLRLVRSHRLTPLHHLPATVYHPRNTPTRSKMTSTIPAIILTANEQRLADLLVGCADWVEQHPEEVDALRLKDENGQWVGKERGNEPVELRIAGGWVRDKLLGRESDDIDVSTSPDPITGLKFAMLFEKYLESRGERDLMGRLTTIEAKPEQSKHLETATARVCDLSVDWVQQRGQEVYTEGSRIPTVAFGTPLEDAERRDLTINALFYNLRTRLIEDQTGLGLSDLGFVPGQPKLIRTPTEPFKTFRDDPLRVVRAVRFAARFGREFALDGGMVEAIGREEIRHALLDPKKISRERVGTELDKMLLGKDPHYAYTLIERLNLHTLIFLYDHSTSYPADGTLDDPPPALPDTRLSVSAASILSTLLHPSSTSPLPSLHPLLQLTTTPLPPLPPSSAPPTYPSLHDPASFPITSVYPLTLKRLFLSCGLLPLYSLYTIEKKKTLWVGEKVVKDGVKGPVVDAVFTKRARDGALLLSGAVEKYGAEGVMEHEEEDRAEIGLLLRNPNVHDGQHVRWNVSLLWSLVVDLVGAREDPEASQRLVASYNRLVERIVEYGLDHRAFEPPLLDGKTLNALHPFTKNSPSMPKLLDLILRFQFSDPSATKTDAEAYITSAEMTQVVEELVRTAKPVEKVKQKKGVKRKEGEE